MILREPNYNGNIATNKGVKHTDGGNVNQWRKLPPVTREYQPSQQSLKISDVLEEQWISQQYPHSWIN